MVPHTLRENVVGWEREVKNAEKEAKKEKKKKNFNLLYYSEKYQTLLRRTGIISKIIDSRLCCLEGLPLHFQVYIEGGIKLPQVFKLFSCWWHLQSRAMYEGPSHPGAHGQKLFVRTGGCCDRGCRGHPSSANAPGSSESWYVSLASAGPE